MTRDEARWYEQHAERVVSRWLERVILTVPIKAIRHEQITTLERLVTHALKAAARRAVLRGSA